MVDIPEDAKAVAMQNARQLVEDFGHDPQGLLVGAIAAALTAAADRATRAARAEGVGVTVPRGFLDFLRNAPVSSGVCCCGDEMDKHDAYCGHSGVDMWDHSLAEWLKKIEEADRATQAGAAGGWLPISTVPMESTQVLLFFPSYRDQPVGAYRLVHESGPAWESLDGWGDVEGEDAPTHWMPLPAPPGSLAPPDADEARRQAEIAELRAREDELDRLYALACEEYRKAGAAPVHYARGWLWSRGAMLPESRAALRARAEEEAGR